MRIKGNNQRRLSIFLIVLCLGYACDDDTSPALDTNSSPMAGEMTMTAGMAMNAGLMSPQAGDMVAGTQTVAGSSMIAGTDMGGVEVGGDVAMAGMMGGEMMAGMMGGEPIAPCTPFTEWTPAEQQGSIYLAHFLTSEVIQYRVDGDFPYEYGRFDVGGEPHDASLNAQQDLYAVALNITQQVELYTLRDLSNSPTFTPPSLTATIDTSPYTPRRVFFDTARQRLFVFGNAPLEDGLLNEMFLFMFDVSDPSQPRALTPEPTRMPVSTVMAVEPKAGILGLVELTTHHLYLYDVSGDQPILHEGDPIDLLMEFPEEGGQDAFQVRNMRFDPIRGRLYMARAQSIASEVIAYKYPPVEAKPMTDDDEEVCAEVFSYADLNHIPDAFDVSLPTTERAQLLGGFVAIPMIGEEFLLFISYAWRGSSIAAMVNFMQDDGTNISHLPACDDYESFGCFYTSYYNDMPSSYNHFTDGPGCVDQRYGIFAGAGLEDDENSQLFLFKINRETGTMRPFLSETGRNLSTSQYPVELSCH
jgi:hypothetical protein